MSNPRNINQVIQSASATQKARLPSIPIVNSGSILDVVTAMKERSEVREGERGNPFERVVTYRDLEELGLVRTMQAQTGPSSLSGVVCQSASGEFVLVSIADLAQAIKAA